MTDKPDNEGQDSIRSSKVSRTAALVGTGAKVGINYLKHYGRKSLGQRTDRDDLDRRNAEDIYETFSRLKGGPLKMAQMFSIDQGLLPAAYAKEFSKAQYSAPPLSWPLVVRTFRREMGRSPTEVFDTFETKAAHGASIGQVHRATKGGHAYAVKVQYPGVAQSLRSDLAVVKPIALQIMGVREKDVNAYIREVEERLLEETDYVLELRRSIQLSNDSRCVANVNFPRYYPELSNRRVLTMDWIDGMPLDKFADSNAPPAERNRIGQALWDLYHHQIHELKLFHADPHPGNFLVRDGALFVLDFGCAKQLDEDFYRKNFSFLDPRLPEDRELLGRLLDDMSILLPTDTAEEREAFIDLCTPSITLLSKPFREGRFDFGDPDFMRSIWEMGHDTRQGNFARGLRGMRGSVHSVYVNRAYFGLYSLLSRLRANVETGIPGWVGEMAA
jgi:predicted unusual protein kinase regulating ubiquinone biosynthesis (AarF/ABC1/UbiB family)